MMPSPDNGKNVNSQDRPDELSPQELDAVTGGALEAHISVSGQKSGQFKGEGHASDPGAGGGTIGVTNLPR